MRFGHFADWAHYEESCALVEKIWRARMSRRPKVKAVEQTLEAWHAKHTKVANVAKRRISHARRQAAC